MLSLKLHRYADVLFTDDPLWQYDCAREAVDAGEPLQLTVVGSPILGACVGAGARMTCPVPPECPPSLKGACTDNPTRAHSFCM